MDDYLTISWFHIHTSQARVGGGRCWLRKARKRTLGLVTPRSLKMAHWTWIWLLTAVFLPGNIDAATLSISGSTPTAVASTREIRLTCSYTLSTNETATTLTWEAPGGESVLTWNLSSTHATTKSHWTSSTFGTNASAVLPPNYVTTTSGGVYKCRLISTLGTETETQTVTIQYKPTVTLNFAGSHDVNEGKPLFLTCSALAVPTASIKWKKGSTNLSGTSVNKPSAVRSDVGTYTCTATNNMISGTGTATATVAVTINYLDTPSMSMTDTTVKENQTITISCNVSSVPTPTLTIRGPVSSHRTQNSRSAYRTFRAGCSDKGAHQCLATNANFSSPKTTEKTLRVLCKPRQQSSSLKNVTKKVNESALFSANIIADPLPQFTWSHKDLDTGLVTKIQNSSGHFEIINNDLTSSLNVTVLNADDYAEYILEVKNGEGETTLNYRLRSETAPFRVSTLKKANATTDSITVLWASAFNGGATQQYFLEYQTTADRDSREWTQKTSEIEDPGRKKFVYATVSDIHPARTYTFRIFSKNVFGNSTHSNYINVTTSEVPQQLTVGAGIGIGLVISLLLVAIIAGCFVLYVKKIRPMRRRATDKTDLKINNPEYDPQSVDNPDTSNYSHLEVNTRVRDSPETYDDLNGAPVYQNFNRAQNNPADAVSPDVYENVSHFKEAEQEPNKKHPKKKNKKEKKGKSKDRREAYENTAAHEDLYANS
ncbi:hemicentin-2-like isoform X2 [Haliotis rufescens]|uniref:hemicentin-2-like isoform X2 n=1 Tax=Haliotis rufescens TaxID=6454 RepID=UPI00201F3924|nr:hemicentin-2-like isoform X2 [Haliotis rufescens]